MICPHHRGCNGEQGNDLNTTLSSVPTFNDILSIFQWLLQQLLEVGMIRLVLVTSITPGSDSRSMEHYQGEEGIQKKHHIRSHLSSIQQHRLRRSVERVRDQGRLNHHETVVGVLTTQHHTMLFLTQLNHSYITGLIR